MADHPKTLYLIDGSGFIFRAYHALPPLTAPDGTPVGAVMGFVNMLIKLRGEHKGDYMAVIFDAARHTFRNRIYAEYKANRPPAPEDLIPQFPIVREATQALGLPAIELADYEADDIIATYATEAKKQGMNVVIVSSDKDLMQLVGDGISMFDAMKQKNIGAAEVKEKFGVAPGKVREVLALMGDSSDNVPGVPSIGPKTAAELITQYGDLETLLSRLSEIKQPKRRETLQNNIEQARVSYELVGLKYDVPLPLPMEKLVVEDLKIEPAIEFCQKYGFKSTVGRLQSKAGSAVPPPVGGRSGGGRDDSGTERIMPPPQPSPYGGGKYTIVRSEAELAAWIAKARQAGHVAFDTETTGLDALKAELVGFSLCVNAGEACYVPLAHVTAGAAEGPKQDDLFAATPKRTLAANQIPMDKAIALIKPLLEDESVMKIGHNIKYDLLIMCRFNIDMKPVDDSMLLSYCLHAGEHGQGMDELSEKYLGYTPISYDEVTGTGRGKLRFDEVDIEKAAQYAAEDAEVTLRLYQFFKPQLFAAKVLSLYETIEKPLVGVLSRMERAGIKVDVSKLAGLSKDFESRMRVYEQEIQQLAGADFNVGSPKQLGEILFEKMQLPGGRKSAKTGAYSTDNNVLEELAEAGHEIAAKVIEWRQLSKLKSTYSDSLVGEIDANHRIHTSFTQAIAQTGRLSSNNPNLQNIPIRTEEGKKIRAAFIAEPGCKLLSADYSQIELRLLAHMADIGSLKEAFKNGQDIHAITASQMFGVPVAEVNADLRRSAKMINFGIIYGMSAHGLATRLGIGRQEASAYIGQYFAQYPGIRDFMEASKEFARKHGYVATLYGRRIHLPGISDKNGMRRQFAERQAINAPLQGTAADIIKKAMVAIDKSMPAGAQMLLQVHDELVFEVKDESVDSARHFVKQAMEGAASLSVPLTVETGVGSNWGEAH